MLGAILLAVTLAAACVPSEREQQLQATVEALAAENATLQAAQPSAAQPTQAPTAAAVIGAAPSQSGAAAPAGPPRATDEASGAAPPVVPAAGAAALAQAANDAASPLPLEIARIEITNADTPLADFRLDSAARIAYLTDAAYNLHVVDLAAGAVVASLPTSGDRLLLDAPNQRLYIMPDAPFAREGISPTVTVFNTASRAIVAELPGSRAGIDSAGGRLYIGDDVGFYGREEPGVRLYDAESLDLIRTGTLAGNPLYDPAADGLIIQNTSAWTADAETLEPQTDLYPEISAMELPGCNGCPAVVDAFYFPNEEVVAIQPIIMSPQGAGRNTPADLYRAATMERVTGEYEMGATCSSQPQLVFHLDGRRLRTERYTRYVTYNNLILEDLDGDSLIMRDGLWAGFVNAAIGVAYMQPSSTHSYVLDVGTLTLVGMTDSLCFFAQEGAGGRLYATDAARGALVVLEPSGGPSKLSAAQPDGADGKQVTQIVLSPDFARDGTLYLVAWTLDATGGQAILRSTDGGQSFTRLGGLPNGEELALTLAISPNFAQDKTLFAGGLRREAMGEGVWKSTDGGDTWIPVWEGLAHLRINRIEISPRFADDETMLAYAVYTQITPMETGYSIHRSTDGGLHWTRVMTVTGLDLLPDASAYLPVVLTEALPVRKESMFSPIEVRIAGTDWTTATNALGAGEVLRGLWPSPEGATPPAIFVATDSGLYRTLDQGVTWSRLAESATNREALMAAAITPQLGDGAYRLLLATADGALLQLDPNTVAWEVVTAETRPEDIPEIDLEAAAETTPAAATPIAAPTPTPVAVDGLAGAPPAGLFRPAGLFGPQWEADGTLQSSLGFARSVDPQSVPAAIQYFENGVMIWRGDNQTIYVIYDGGAWDLFDDTFQEGETESDPALIAPNGLLQPIRGFGKVWRSDEVVRERLGWAVSKETAINALVQDFERGLYIVAEGVAAALIQRPASREWVR
jgi:photosystem II stability/assembly factor-like uncharacterized protein